MKTATHCRIDSSLVGISAHEPRQGCRITRIILAMACLAGVTAVQAQGVGDLDAAAGYTSDTPWASEILAATAIDAYVPDPSFRGGLFGLDHFASANNLDQVGLVNAQLANGDIVVAGLVPDGVGGGSCSDGTKLCSIGLVRYNAAGQRVAWTNPGSNGRYFDNYSVFPGASSSAGIQYLRDVNVRGNFIDVLVDSPDSSHPALTLGHRNVIVYTFRDDGSILAQAPVFGHSSAAAGDAEDFYGAQMVQMNSTTMIIAATAYDSTGSYIAVTRLGILDNGLMSYDYSWGTGYGDNNSYIRLTRYFAPVSNCGTPRCDVNANYVVKPAGSSFEDFYVAGSVHVAGNNWDPIVAKISSQHGGLKTEFTSTGWRRVGFNDTNSSKDDRAAGLYVYQNDVYVAAQVARKCHNGIGLAKLDGNTGNFNNGFGTFGKVTFGGQGDDTFCNILGTASVPFAISATGGRIGIVGYQRFKMLSGSIYIDPMLAVVNAVNGTLLDIDNHPVKRADGTRYGDAILFGIYGGPSPTSPFTVSGYGRDASDGNTLSYLSGRLIPVSADRIFASGFGSGDDY